MIDLREKVSVKVCQTYDKASILAAISALKYSEADNIMLGLGLFEGENYNLFSQYERNYEAIAYIRELSYNLNLNIKIVCVTNITDADELSLYLKKTDDNLKKSFIKTTYDFLQINSGMPVENVQKIKNIHSDRKVIVKFAIFPNLNLNELNNLENKIMMYAENGGVDGILLDSSTPGKGVKIDWELAKKIIKRIHDKTSKPAGLAGGLSFENAGEAIKLVNPDFIDADTGFRFDREGVQWTYVSDGEITKAPKDAFAILSVLNLASKYYTNYRI